MQHPSTSTAPPSSPAKPGDQIVLDVTLESMASVHATGDVGLLSDVRAPAPGEEQEEEAFAGGVVAAALGRLATPHFDVPDVRHVPGLGRRAVVISVGELALRGLVVRFEFEPRTCDVREASTGAIVGRGRMRGGRYYLDYLRVPSS